MFVGTMPQVELCVNLCETTRHDVTPTDVERIVGCTCQEAGFPHCERVYVGSYFCENSFCWMGDAFHEAVRVFCEWHDVRATLVVPIAGQAFLERVDRRIGKVLDRFEGLYDEVVANDVARFHDLVTRYGEHVNVGLGRLLSKEMRDARIGSLMERRAVPMLAPEALSCLRAVSAHAPASDPATVVELDPIANVVDVSGILQEEPNARIALHLPMCFATTGRNCGPASIGETVDEKFRLGRDCSQQCLRINQDYLTDEGVRYVKNGRTFYFENPGCAIDGTFSWRIIYQAGLS